MRNSGNPAEKKLRVTFFQRRPRKGFSFSLEFIFEDVRKRLKDKIKAQVKICRYYNDGFLTKIYNIIEAGFRQGSGINHVTGEVHFLTFLIKRKMLILTILDCGMMVRKKGIAQYIVKFLYLNCPVRRAKFVTAISEETKNQIIKYTGCPPQKITVIPVAVDPVYQPSPKVFNAFRPNILHIGTGYNKNLFRLIEALEGINCHLTIIGKLNQEHLDLLNAKSVSFSNGYNLSQIEILEKYKECDILSFVSTFEGFGMPIVEANCVERVVITSNLSSMPEVAADAACLVDPFNTAEIRKGILRLMEDSAYRDTLINNGRKNKMRFDPDKIANLYYALYCNAGKELLSKK